MSVFPESRLSIITIGVRDRAAMTAFYRDTIGLKLVFEKGMTMFEMGGFVFGLWEADKLAEDAGMDAKPAEGFRNVALAYNARSKEEVDEIFGRLEAAGVNITTKAHESFWGGYSGYFADPEGNSWEVAFNPYWTFDEAGRVVLPEAKA